MKNIIIILIHAFLLSSCFRGECGSHVRLGEIKLSNESRKYIPYNGNETLIFVDEHGVNHKLKSEKEKELSEIQSVARELCSNGFLDHQYEYYDTQTEEIVFQDSLGKQIFYARLSTIVEPNDDSEKNAIIDYLTIPSGIYGMNTGVINIVTLERKNEITPYQQKILNLSESIGDTTFFNREFKDVYKGKGKNEDNFIYYNKELGVIAFSITKDKYWVLKN